MHPFFPIRVTNHWGFPLTATCISGDALLHGTHRIYLHDSTLLPIFGSISPIVEYVGAPVDNIPVYTVLLLGDFNNCLTDDIRFICRQLKSDHFIISSAETKLTASMLHYLTDWSSEDITNFKLIK